ncbi:response regulator transcription factor [Neotabrizicola sp. sgz301269]|uniref:response regulator transcription factor n=1 Tax=Neotabrizicola sp. sgz301269 TaxID=3276282 RepID=UPI00377038D6
MGLTAPVIFLTGHADVPVAVRTLKAGAFDFVEKPFNDNQIVDLAIAAMDRHAAERAGAAEHEALAARLSGLSAREDEVMRLMLQGLLNKQIAAGLGIAMRTVEVHRGRVLAKLGAQCRGTRAFAGRGRPAGLIWIKSAAALPVYDFVSSPAEPRNECA